MVQFVQKVCLEKLQNKNNATVWFVNDVCRTKIIAHSGSYMRCV